MSVSGDVICPKCHAMRSGNMKEPCIRCGSKQTPFGYVRPHEFKGDIVLIVGIVVILGLAALGALVFWLFLQANSQTGWADFLQVATSIEQFLITSTGAL